MRDGEAQCQRAAERLTDDHRRLATSRDRANNGREVVDQRVHVGGRIAERVRGDAKVAGEECDLTVEEPSSSIHARDENDWCAASFDADVRLILAALPSRRC